MASNLRTYHVKKLSVFANPDLCGGERGNLPPYRDHSSVSAAFLLGITHAGRAAESQPLLRRGRLVGASVHEVL
jgi:hypothetical protein